MVLLDCCIQVLWIQIQSKVSTGLPGIGKWWNPVCWHFNLCCYAHGDHLVSSFFTSGYIATGHFHSVWMRGWSHHTGGYYTHQESILYLQPCLGTQWSTVWCLLSCLCEEQKVSMGQAWIVACGCCLSYVSVFIVCGQSIALTSQILYTGLEEVVEFVCCTQYSSGQCCGVLLILGCSWIMAAMLPTCPVSHTGLYLYHCMLWV